MSCKLKKKFVGNDYEEKEKLDWAVRGDRLLKQVLKKERRGRDQKEDQGLE